MKILFASSNAGKLDEVRDLAGRHFTVVAPTPPLPEVVEDSPHYHGNALKKAVAFHKAYGMPVLSDDSGLEVEALGGAPGVLSARFGGEKLTWPERWAELHRQLAGTPAESWKAAFRCVLCYYDGEHEVQFFEGTVEGLILPSPRGSQGFGYDPVFYCPALGKSFGEIPKAEKALLSHRAVAVRKFLTWLVSLDHASRHG